MMFSYVMGMSFGLRDRLIVRLYHHKTEQRNTNLELV